MKAQTVIDTSFEIIFDNGGGATLQNHSGTVCINYSDMEQLACDASELINGNDSPEDWDGNEPGNHITDEEYEKHAQNGGYFALQLDPDYLDNWPDSESTGWNNVSAFIRSITCPCGKIACRIGHSR